MICWSLLLGSWGLARADRIEAATEAIRRYAIETRSRSRHHQSPFTLSSENDTGLETARKRFENVTVLETRSRAGDHRSGHSARIHEQRLAGTTIVVAVGIPTTAPAGYAGVVPQFTLPGEGTNHAEFDGVNPDAVTVGRAGA
jgi:hypothetical protein